MGLVVRKCGQCCGSEPICGGQPDGRGHEAVTTAYDDDPILAHMMLVKDFGGIRKIYIRFDKTTAARYQSIQLKLQRRKQ
jgi:hypothetical protein